MKVPSRRMPKLPAASKRPLRQWQWLLCVTLVTGLLVIPAAALVVAIWRLPLLLFPLAAVIVTGTINTRAAERRMRELGASRPAESICEFARSFNCRSTDTWIIRAVYEELQDHVEMRYPRHPSFPVRAEDSIWQDLDVLPDEIDDIVGNIAQRTRRNLDGGEQNPFAAVETVRDLVMFFQHQTRLDQGAF